MLKIIGITDRNGNSKDDSLNQIIENHNSPYGYFLNEIMIDRPFEFQYRDDENYFLRSSTVQDYQWSENDNLHIITTRNSIYYIQEVW